MKRIKKILMFIVAAVGVILLVFAAAEICKSDVPIWAKIVTLITETYMYARLCKKASRYEQDGGKEDEGGGHEG